MSNSLIDLHSQRDLQRFHLARRMIELGCRPPMVQASLGISIKLLRRMWSDYHGKSSPQGMLPNSSRGIIKNSIIGAKASIFSSLYRKLAGNAVFLSMDVENLVKTYEIYQWNEIDPQGDISLAAAWTIARDLVLQNLSLKRCTSCRVSYLYDIENTSLRNCCFCRIK